ncbi:amidase family protein [Nocardiopsis sp. RSe5-2]|uniref:Amidase family protein n=1 Tax=Nocardiopsis endophytica TaxID=3018445 RepID=A0ABT4U855_9ACTN|nr:amidase family protein [Nocardiopsis endophytica]MDA2813135.1 amidase family protein [Nocardiopsis endophytica]
MGGTTRTGDGLHCWVPDTFGLEPLADGPLSGAGFAAKDLFAVAGHTSSFGHPRWRATHGPAEETAPAVTALRSAGAHLVGMAKLDQLAYSVVGNVGEGAHPLNPAHPDRHTGGSSSGSASAVAGGAADIALGTDTAGSVRVPAACCGILGLRPTHGALDAAGVLPLAPSFDTVGLFAREPGPLRAAFDAVEGGPPGLGAEEHGITAVHLPDDFPPQTSEATVRAVHGLAVLLAGDLGLPLLRADLTGLVGTAHTELFARLQSREIWDEHAEWVTANADALDADVRERLRRCESLAAAPLADRKADEAARAHYRDTFARVCPPGAVIALPVLADGALRRGAGLDERKRFRATTVRLSTPASLAGAPQLTVPVDAEGLPGGRSAGVGLLAAPGHDRALLRAAEVLYSRRPTLRDR